MTVANAAATIARNTELGVLGVRFPEPWLLMLQCLLMKRSDREIQKAFSDQYAVNTYPTSDPDSASYQPVCGTLGSLSLYSRTKGRLGHVISCY